MNNMLLRVLTFFIMIPLLFGLIILLPHRNHLAYSILAVVVSAAATTEIYALMSNRIGQSRIQRRVVPFLGATLPAFSVLSVQGFVEESAIGVVITAVASLILIMQSFRNNENEFDKVLPNASGNLLLLLYPGIFMTYIIRMTTMPSPTVLIIVFLAAVYFNDTGAYLAGRALGRFSPKPFPISPNKSLIGFAGGFIISPAVILVAGAIFPELFPGGPWPRILFGAIIGLATIAGDLAESALKRAVTAKDSGSIIPGRGGLLDSIDSVMMAAPVFFHLYPMIF